MNFPRSLTYLAYSLIGFSLTAFPCFASAGGGAAAQVPSAQLDFSTVVRVDTEHATYSPLYLPVGLQFVGMLRGEHHKSQGEIVHVRDGRGEDYALRIVPLVQPGRYSGESEQLATYLGKVKREREILKTAGGSNGILGFVGSYHSPDRSYQYLLTTHHDFYFNNIIYNYRLNEEHIKYIAEQLLHSFAHLHAQRIVHGNFSPNSIGINNDSETFISDFGLETAHLGVGAYTMDFSLDEFKAPEQLFSAAKPEPSADLWSLGLILARTILGSDFLAPQHRDSWHYLRTMVNTLGTREVGDYVATCGQDRFSELVRDTMHRVESDNKPNIPLSALLAKKKISPQGIMFITSLLRFDPRNRLTARQALAHPWITSGYSTAEKEEDAGDD
jgi:serine/threonine protein kinase